MDQYGQHGGGPEMFYVILPYQATDTYSAVKQKTCVDYGGNIMTFGKLIGE